MLESFMIGINAVFTLEGLLFIIIGVIVGIIFGSIPGLSATMAIALFLPVTYGMSPLNGIILLIGLYIGGISGGLISAILTRIPGTPSSIATCFDGYPMTQKGQGARALGIGVAFSFIGTVLSTIVLIFISPQLAKVAINFGNYEYFAVAIFSLTMVAGLAGKSMVKGLVSAVLGWMFATVGMDLLGSVPRFTFGANELMAGFNILPVLIGMFAISEILTTAEKARLGEQSKVVQVNMKQIKGLGFTIKELLGQAYNTIRSALIGIGIGILPGIGGGTANMLAYSVAKNQSKHPEKYGTGVMDGLVASETSNNAAIGGTLIPLLTLGIPGDTVTAMLLGGLTIHGIVPGPLLFQNNIDIVYGIFIAMIVAATAMLVIEFYGLRMFVRLLKIPKHILLPVIFLFCVVGAFGLNNRLFDVWTILFFGLLGYLFTKFKIPTSPFILGFIIGPMAETNLRRGLMFSGNDFTPFLTSPISAIFLLASAFSIGFAIYKKLSGKRSGTEAPGL